MSSSAGRPVHVEVARVGARREVVFSSDAVAADEHETPHDASSKGCGWPVALTLDVDPTWRSGYYEVVMEIDVGEKVRRDYAFFVVRPSPGRGSSWRWRPIRGTPTTTSADRICTPVAPRSPCSGRWRRATSTSHRERVVA